MLAFITNIFLFLFVADLCGIFPIRYWIIRTLEDRRKNKQLRELSQSEFGKTLPYIPGESVEKYRQRLIQERNKKSRELEKIMKDEFLLSPREKKNDCSEN